MQKGSPTRGAEVWQSEANKTEADQSVRVVPCAAMRMAMTFNLFPERMLRLLFSSPEYGYTLDGLFKLFVNNLLDLIGDLLSLFVMRFAHSDCLS